MKFSYRLGSIEEQIACGYSEWQSSTCDHSNPSGNILVVKNQKTAVNMEAWHVWGTKM
jgi:hypothetical protein